MTVTLPGRRLSVVLLLLAASACTARNERYCGDGVCIDPAYPFCDIDGSLGGKANTCIPVACTPGEFESCRGDQAVTCNATGTNYELASCDLGCSPETTGCRLCEPNQTACTNGKVATCDASGAVTASEVCLLGCFEDQPRCREIEPSNGLGAYMAMASAGPDLVLSSATLTIPSGHVDSASGAFDLPSVLVQAPKDGVPIQVFSVHSLAVVGNLEIRSGGGNAAHPAVAFVVAEDVKVDGVITLHGVSRGAPPPGAVLTGPCVGLRGTLNPSSSGVFIGGGGGGGGATQGGAGGAFPAPFPGIPGFPGGAGGAPVLNPTLQPLRGGCSGGSHDNTITPTYGGGALQITSATRIRIGPNSTLQANADSGYIVPNDGLPGSGFVPTGGGAGGGILLEAPSVELASSVVLVANGGAGASGDGAPGTTPESRLPASGGVCTSITPCTNGGDGGSTSGAARPAPSLTVTGEQVINTGAGGGAVGFIRINTKEGVYVKANDVFESPVPSSGTIATR